MMKKITLLLLMLVSYCNYGQTCEQDFFEFGYDDESLSLTINASDLTCYAGTVNSITISEAYLEGFDGDMCGDYYTFSLDIDGQVTSVCADDLVGMVITDFQTLTITASDADNYSDFVIIEIYIEINYIAVVAPDCAVITLPQSDTLGANQGILGWNQATGAPAGYRITLGTFPGGNDIIDSFDVGNVLTYDIPGNLSSATQYFLAVTPYNSIGNAVGCAEYEFTTASAADNDNCRSATALQVDANFCDGFAVNGSNAMATDSGVESAECFNYGKNDVWFSFVGPQNTASVNISTDFTGGTLVDTEIALYTGDCDGLVELACSQDEGTTILSNGFSYNSIITDYPVEAGYSYLVRVSGYSETNRGTFCLEISTNRTLSNQDFDLASFKAYPNPVKDFLSLSYKQEISEVSIFNLLGQKVFSKSLNATESKIDMSNLSQGTYLVKAVVDGQVKSFKVIKQ